MKLFIFSHGDESVGLNPYEFEIECPFEKEGEDEAVLEWFKERQVALYNESLDCYVKGVYDFELKEMH
jgi:hypothetical protein